jgi:hypothetical protein
MLALRMSSPLIRLNNSEEIIEKVSFLNVNSNLVDKKYLGLLVMKIDDSQGKSVDDNVSSLMVIFNTSTEVKTFPYKQSQGYKLHPIQQNGIDEVLKQAQVTATGFSVPSLSSVVFVKKVEG